MIAKNFLYRFERWINKIGDDPDLIGRTIRKKQQVLFRVLRNDVTASALFTGSWYQNQRIIQWRGLVLG